MRVVTFDDAKSHVDYEIVETVNQYDVVLYCFPFITTDEYYWNQQVMLYQHNHGERTLPKQRFGKVFTPVWDLCMMPSNINSGFGTIGLYPYYSNAILKDTFKPIQHRSFLILSKQNLQQYLYQIPNYDQLFAAQTISCQLLYEYGLVFWQQIKSIPQKLL